MFLLYSLHRLKNDFKQFKAGTEIIVVDNDNEGMITAEIGPWGEFGEPTSVEFVPIQLVE